MKYFEEIGNGIFKYKGILKYMDCVLNVRIKPISIGNDFDGTFVKFENQQIEFDEINEDFVAELIVIYFGEYLCQTS